MTVEKNERFQGDAPKTRGIHNKHLKFAFQMVWVFHKWCHLKISNYFPFSLLLSFVSEVFGANLPRFKPKTCVWHFDWKASATEILISKNISTNHSKGQFKTVLKLVEIFVEGQFFVALAFWHTLIRQYNHVQARSSQL